MLAYNPIFDWQTNIRELAGKLRSLAVEHKRDRERQPVGHRVEWDATTAVLEAQAKAAESGRLWWRADARSRPDVAMNSVLMEWYREAKKRGMLAEQEAG